MTGVAQLIQHIDTMDEAQLRRTVFSVGGEGPDPGHLYQHQVEALRRIELGAPAVPPISGIVHYPTGAGKTRVALELIARALHQDPRHRFIWATARRNLIRQSMVRLAELSRVFPSGATFTWAKNADEVENSGDDVHVTFMTRRALTDTLERAGDGRRKNHPWRLHLDERRPMTLIYDECHQLGAEQLQRNWRKFYEVAIAPPRVWRRPWRTIGLSATPVPTQFAAQRLLGECIFPRREDGASTSHDWPFHVFHRVTNDALVDSGVLCPINLRLDESGTFDIPEELLEAPLQKAQLAELGAFADKKLVQQYALQFNSSVLSDPAVLEFLATRIGQSIDLLGKTIVFVPNIAAANRMAAILYERFPNLRGKIAAVHSRMYELRVPGQEESTVHEVLAKFRERGSERSVLINVDMLTEGFDDPKIRSVVLARLTLSTNRFWQMIGRGTRGPASKGTADCSVIDPIKLVRLYDYFGGYQPSLIGQDDVEFEELEEAEDGSGRLNPQIGAVRRPPDPACGAYDVDPELARINLQVATALRHFLRGEALSEDQALAAATAASVEIVDGRALLTPSTGEFSTTTAYAMLLGEISSLERRTGKELGWVRRQLPDGLNEVLLRQRLRMLRAIEELGLWTEASFAAAQMDGAYLACLQRKAEGTCSSDEQPVTSVAPAVSTIALPPFTQAEQAVVDAGLVIAAANGTIVPAEINVICETLRRMFARASTDALEEMIRRCQVPFAIPFETIETQLQPVQRQLLLLQLAEVAASDGIVTQEERAALDSYADRLQLPSALVEAVLGSHLARADIQQKSVTPQPSCSACGFDTPAGASFCPACGSRL